MWVKYRKPTTPTFSLFAQARLAPSACSLQRPVAPWGCLGPAIDLPLEWGQLYLGKVYGAPEVRWAGMDALNHVDSQSMRGTVHSTAAIVTMCNTWISLTLF